MEFQSNSVRPMKRFRNRKLICAAAVVLAIALGTSVFSEAAGPREFVSGLWKKRPALKKVTESKLNPRNWMSRYSDRKDSSRVSDAGSKAGNSADGAADSSVRPDLYQDPFAVSGKVTKTADSETAVAQRSSPTAAPSPRQRREASRRSTISQPSERENPTRQVARREATESSAPVLPDGLQGDARTPVDGSQESGPVSALLRPDSGNQFAPGFDSEFQRVVQSVIRETETTRPETKPSTRAMSGADDVRGPVLAPQLPNHVTGSHQESLLSANDVDQLIDRSRRDMTTTLAVPSEQRGSPQIHSRLGQPQRPVSLTDGTSPLLGGGHPAMLVPTSEGESVLPTTEQTRRQPDLRHEFSTGRSVPQRAEQLSPSRGPVRPRVVSNGAPIHSVPNNPRHERISYSSEEESPVFGTVLEGPAIPRRENEGHPRGLEGVSSAPEIDWSLDRDPSEASSSLEVPWGFAGIIVASITTLFAILLLRRRQVVTVVTSAPDAARESD